MSRRFGGSVSQFVSRSEVEQKAMGIAHQPLRFLWGSHNHEWRRKNAKDRQRRKDGGKSDGIFQTKRC